MRTALTLLAVIAFAGSCSLLAVWVAFGLLFWVLRDGLGPGSVETTGWAAVGRFAWAWGMPAGTLASSAVASWLLYRRLRRGCDAARPARR